MKGHNKDVITICQANGATSDQYNTALMEMCIAQGATAASMQDMLKEVLTAAGYSGSVDQMWNQWIADTGGLFGPAFDHTFLIKNFFGTFYGFETGAGHSTEIDPRTFDWSGTAQVVSLYTSTATTGLVNFAGTPTPDFTGQTFDFYLEGFDGDNAQPMTGSGTQLTFVGGIPAGLYAYMQAQVNNTLGLLIVETTP